MESRALAKKQAIELTESIARENSYKVAEIFNNAIFTAKNIGNTLESIREGGEADRMEVIDLIKHYLDQHPEYHGIWTAWEENAFDGDDTSYKNTQYHDASGRFLPYLYRSGEQIGFEILEGYNEEGRGDYYLIPIREGKQVIMEPEIIDQESRLLLIRLGVPVIDGNKAVGVVGIDIVTDEIQKIISQIHLYDTGFGRIFSNKGLVVAHKEISRVGDIAGELQQGTEEEIRKNRESIEEGLAYSGFSYSIVEKQDAFKATVPIFIGETDTPWALGTVVMENEMYKEANQAMKMVLVVVLVGTIILAAIIWWISKYATSPIIFASAMTRKLADLDINIEIEEKHLSRKDELGDLARDFRILSANLKDILENIMSVSGDLNQSSISLSNAAGEVAMGSEEVAKTLDEVARSTSEQAGEIERGSVMTSQIDKIIEETIRHIEKLRSFSEEVNSLAEQGNKSVDDLIQNAASSSQAVETIEQGIVSTDESVKEIAKSSKMINSIAEQTSLLALNAAIEAARAGEAGRGFSVVAEEIRKLAEESSSFTNEIDNIIRELLEKSGETVESTKILVDAIENQNASSYDTEEKFNGIAQAIKTIIAGSDQLRLLGQSTGDNKDSLVDMIQNLSAIGEENAAAAEEVSATSEEQAASIQEVARASQELSKLSEELNKLISRFKI
ncbi:MAG: methyl-accepting chemotaxis protein [Tissierellaceae bacterium]|nr:methyl-accepting chemotaxis protein [Tissierellaceae bacterium]